MRKVLLVLMIASPLIAAAADSPPRIQTRPVVATVEDLAHSFFFHSPRSQELLARTVSQQGVHAVSPAAVAEHKRMMNAPDVLLRKARNLCTELQNAQTGEEFAATFTRWDQDERAERRQHAVQLLSLLDEYDRKALEDYLDTEYREAHTSAVVDYQALFATSPFPSEMSKKILRSTCQDVPPDSGGQQ